jgi:hypothetical protein
MINNTRIINYNDLFEIWADFDDAKSNNEVKKLIEEKGLENYDAASFMGFCYGYHKAMNYQEEGMSGISVYFIIEGEDTEDARDMVENWLEEYMGREFYERYDISRTDVKRIFEFEPGYFENLLRESEERAEHYRKEIEEYCTQNDQWGEGSAHVNLGNIMMRSFCEDMPYWNLKTGNWNLPDKDDWAVMVTLK